MTGPSLTLRRMAALDRVIIEANELACMGDLPQLGDAVDQARDTYWELLRERADTIGIPVQVAHAHVRDLCVEGQRQDGVALCDGDG